jgi:DNA-binding PadR family transcriptional regulator
MRFFWPRAESQIYEEAKGLVTKGLAKDRQSFTGRRARTSYAITARGRKQLRDWLASPPKPTALECEPLLRVFLGGLGTDDQLRAALAQVRADAHAILEVGRVVGAEYLAGTAPFQDHVHTRALVFDFLSHHALMLLDWADRAELTVTAWSTQTGETRQRAALECIRDTFALYPVALSPTTADH